MFCIFFWMISLSLNMIMIVPLAYMHTVSDELLRHLRENSQIWCTLEIELDIFIYTKTYVDSFNKFNFLLLHIILIKFWNLKVRYTVILFQKLIFLIIKISKASQPLERSARYFHCSFFVYVSKNIHNFLLISTISNNF